MTTADLPDIECADYQLMEKHWELPRDLMGGTIAMREKSGVYLPSHEAESDANYRARVAKTVLRNYFRRSIESMTSKVFAEPIAIGDDVPKDIVAMLEDVDLQGRHLNVFAHDVFMAGVQDGLTHILVDFPVNEPGLTLADERTKGLRPYAVHIKAENLIGWRFQMLNGKQTLTQIRIREYLKRPSGEFDEDIYEQVRVLEQDNWRIYERSVDAKGKASWNKTQEGANTLGYIPLSTFYTNRLRFMYAEPPMEDLAYMNLEHFQIRSDQRVALSVASFPILAASGWTQGQGAAIEFGPLKCLTMTDPNGKFYYVESQGAHLKAGAEELEALEEAMATYALQFQIKKPGNITATSRSLDSAESHSSLQSWALQFGDTLENMLMDFANWTKQKSGGSVKINTNFGLSLKDGQELEQLYKARIAGEITRRTYLNELHRRGLLEDDFDLEAEIEKLGEETQPDAQVTQ